MLSEPVVGKNFFGRRETLNLLDKRIRAMKEGYRQNVAITGTSLAGKSSLLQHFLYTSLDDSFLPIYVEVLKEDFPSFAKKFIATLLYNSLKTREDASSGDINTLISRSEKLFPKTVRAVKEILYDIGAGRPDEAYSALLGLTSIVKAETSKSCIVILDEFDNISNFRLKNPFISFGKVIMIQKDTMYLISSSRGSVIKKILDEKLSLLFGNFEIVEVKGFDSATTYDFLDKKSEPFLLSDEMKRFLAYFTDGNPFYLENISLAARNIAREKSLSAIDRESVEDAILDLVYSSNGVIGQYLNGFLLELLETKCRESSLAILCSISSGHKKKKDIVKDLKRGYGDISKAIAKLTDLGLVSKMGVFYMVSDKMLEFWLFHVYMKRQGMLVNYIVDKARSYKEDIHSYVTDFISASTRSVFDRVMELFNLFSNELIDMDGKQFMLPQCEKVEARTFDDVTPYISASVKSRIWVCHTCVSPIEESGIAEFIRNIRSLDYAVAKKILIPLNGIEENARLLAKELKIVIWDPETVNTLFRLYGIMGLVA